jgi:hypothetical protein
LQQPQAYSCLKQNLSRRHYMPYVTKRPCTAIPACRPLAIFFVILLPLAALIFYYACSIYVLHVLIFNNPNTVNLNMVTLKDFQSICLKKVIARRNSALRSTKILAGTTSHPGAEEVFKQAKPSNPVVFRHTSTAPWVFSLTRGNHLPGGNLATKCALTAINPRTRTPSDTMCANKVVDCHHMTNPHPKDYPTCRDLRPSVPPTSNCGAFCQ